jgi:hypothetical protein
MPFIEMPQRDEALPLMTSRPPGRWRRHTGWRRPLMTIVARHHVLADAGAPAEPCTVIVLPSFMPPQ